MHVDCSVVGNTSPCEGAIMSSNLIIPTMTKFSYEKKETPSGIQHRFYIGDHGFWFLESENRISLFCDKKDQSFKKMLESGLVEYQGGDIYQKSYNVK